MSNADLVKKYLAADLAVCEFDEEGPSVEWTGAVTPEYTAAREVFETRLSELKKVVEVAARELLAAEGKDVDGYDFATVCRMAIPVVRKYA